ncbi:DNA-directed RNA polymerase subunit beta' [Dehalococcoidia bacterium]|nr:DNA-directed RNA polymerase subunit beta' [Dehalococcoidia bacterium]
MLELNDFSSIRISLASPEQIKSWSYGEVTKPETINYRTLKPERDGLFCERIFGPTKDFECYCGKYKKIRYRGVICDKCGVEVTRSSVRRERMGHIQLAAPVAHIWFVKVTPSRLGLLLDLSPRKLEQVIYFAKFIITRVDEDARERTINKLKDDLEFELMQRHESAKERIAGIGASADGEEPEARSQESRVEETPDSGENAVSQIQHQAAQDELRLHEELVAKIEELEEIKPRRLLGVNEYRELKRRWGDIFEAKMGAEAILEVLACLDLGKLREELHQEVATSSGQHSKKAIKRLRVVEAFLKQGTKPEWMIMTVLPVIPPELRPMVQLDGGRFATSDLNDLYRRVINRNNRLKRLMEMGTPEVIIRNEKRMLQEAVDSLIGNGRRGQAVTTRSGHELRSLSDMLRGKQGHFRQNLLGKRVDYSGRSVIVPGPELKLHQCGLPKRMALELFKPFVMQSLIARGLAYNVRNAKRMVEQGNPAVWDILEEVVQDHPVLLNRAPTLHRLGIQAFQPILIDDSAIQLHPLVCAAFNADFDGDQMAVHIPLSKSAVKEAREVMLSTQNMLLPSSREPVVAPTMEMALGCYYLTTITPGSKGEGMNFTDFEDARIAYDLGIIDLGAEITVRRPPYPLPLTPIKTSVGRIILNDALPDELGFQNEVIDKKLLKQLTSECYRRLGKEAAASMLDRIKRLGFEYSTRSGLSVGIGDLHIPSDKKSIIRRAEEEIDRVESQFQEGLKTEDERYQSIIKIWSEATDELTKSMERSLDRHGSIYMMANSGARGNIGQIRQMAGMRGLMSDPSGRIIELPIKANFREGLSVLEFFISTHGARKGLADTALRTSDSGYLTRRLIDVAQQVIAKEEDCGTEDGLWLRKPTDKGILPSLSERIVGRLAARPVIHPESGEVIVDRNGEITTEKAAQIAEAGITEVCVRSPLRCRSRRGICQYCYGIDLARGQLVDKDVAVGIIAAQSIGEPGTQLTMRTFHTGGVAGLDIISGLPRVEELFEARVPRGQAVIAQIDGVVDIIDTEDGRKIKIVNSRVYRDEYPLPPKYEAVVSEGQVVDTDQVLALPSPTSSLGGENSINSILARAGGEVEIHPDQVVVLHEETEEWEHMAPPAASFLVRSGDTVKAGDQLTEGTLNPQDILQVMGIEAVQRYLVDEVQKVYRSQGVNIHDKHIEIIVTQMLRRVRIDSPGDTKILPGELIEYSDFETLNAHILAEGGEPATAHPVLLGITRASLSTASFLAAASFQETTRVLTEAAIIGSVDKLVGLKENVIIGKLIPSRSKVSRDQEAAETLSETSLALNPPS